MSSVTMVLAVCYNQIKRKHIRNGKLVAVRGLRYPYYSLCRDGN